MEKKNKLVCIFHKIKSGIWLSAATCFMLFIYEPLELLFTNQDEFWFDAYTLMPLMFIAFIFFSALSIAAFALLGRINTRLYGMALMLCFAAFICLYIQGNFLTAGLPPLDGEPINWSLYTAERAKSVALWVIVPTAVAIVFKKLRQETIDRILSGGGYKRHVDAVPDPVYACGYK